MVVVVGIVKCNSWYWSHVSPQHLEGINLLLCATDFIETSE